MGGLTEAYAMANMQFITFDAEGNCIGANYMDYLLPTAWETPGFELHEVVTPVPAPPDRRQGRRRVRRGRRSGGVRQRGARRDQGRRACATSTCRCCRTGSTRRCTERPRRVRRAPRADGRLLLILLTTVFSTVDAARRPGVGCTSSTCLNLAACLPGADRRPSRRRRLQGKVVVRAGPGEAALDGTPQSPSATRRPTGWSRRAGRRGPGPRPGRHDDHRDDRAAARGTRSRHPGPLSPAPRRITGAGSRRRHERVPRELRGARAGQHHRRWGQRRRPCAPPRRAASPSACGPR